MAFGLKTWRRWHRKVNLRQRRHALASAIAATAVTSLVMARGHRVSKVPQLPLVLDDEFSKVQKTKEAIAVLKRFGAFEDVERVIRNKTFRAGKGKNRGKKYKHRRGPLIIVNDKSEGLYRATRNIPGVHVLNVTRLNIRHLAPGGQFGRFCIYTKSAFEELARQFGSYNGVSVAKKGYMMKREVLSNPDVAALINSDEVQRVLRNKKTSRPLHPRQKKNPLKNKDLMNKLNPYEAKKREEAAARHGKKVRKAKADKQKFKAHAKQVLDKVTHSLITTETRINDEYKQALAMTKV
jgi:large subunit ribosomal protein L4e